MFEISEISKTLLLQTQIFFIRTTQSLHMLDYFVCSRDVPKQILKSERRRSIKKRRAEYERRKS